MRVQLTYLISLTVLIFNLVLIDSSAQNFYTLTRKADSLFQAKNYANASNYFEKAMSSINEVYIEANDFYYCAASFALIGDSDKSFFYLKKSINRGGISSLRLERDDELIKLKKLKKWNSIIRSAKRKEVNLNINLVKKLKIIEANDQFYRKKLDSISQIKDRDRGMQKMYASKQANLDSINLIETEKILKNGFPTRQQVGSESETLFLVIQHSNLNVMEQYYTLFEKAAEKGDLNWRTLCIMTDRIRKKRGFKQIYGTQIIRDANGKSSLYEVEDFENLNKRRLKIGLEPIEEYVRYWGIKL